MRGNQSHLSTVVFNVHSKNAVGRVRVIKTVGKIRKGVAQSSAMENKE